ncbi:MAG: hypothetical protein JST39_11330, partial [Bacteroidetes bacterium]|nr:hypothetical protein [Bacteroidota bacterium]
TFVYFLAAGLMHSLHALSQTAVADTSFRQAGNQLNRIWTKEIAENSHLYNGSEYLRGGHGVKGSPFFSGADTIPGEVGYDGRLYTGIPMQYDVVDDALVIISFAGDASIQLLKNKVSHFSVGAHRFVHLRSGEGLPADGYYEAIHDGALAAWARRRKSIVEASDRTSSYRNYDTWFLQRESVFHTIESERAVWALLNSKADACKKFARSHKLSFRKEPAAFLAGVLGYYDQLNH